MTDEDSKLAKELGDQIKKGLEEQFLRKPNSETTRQSAIAYLQGMVNQWMEENKIEPGPLPIVDVQIEDSQMHVRLLDHETKEPLTWGQWIDKYSYGRYYGRRD